MLNFFPVSAGQCFLSWKYGRPLDFCLNSLLKLVNLFLLHPNVDTTVFFFFCAFFLSQKHGRRSRHLLEVSLEFGEHFLVSS